MDSHESTTEYVARIRRQLRRERRWSVALVVLAYVVVAGAGVAAVKLAAGDGWGESVGAGVVGVLVATLIVMRLSTLGDPGPLDRP